MHNKPATTLIFIFQENFVFKSHNKCKIGILCKMMGYIIFSKMVYATFSFEKQKVSRESIFQKMFGNRIPVSAKHSGCKPSIQIQSTFHFLHIMYQSHDYLCKAIYTVQATEA